MDFSSKSKWNLKSIHIDQRNQYRREDSDLALECEWIPLKIVTMFRNLSVWSTESELCEYLLIQWALWLVSTFWWPHVDRFEPYARLLYSLRFFSVYGKNPFVFCLFVFVCFFLFFSPSPLLIRESSPRRTRGDHCAGHWRCVRRRATFALRRSSRTSRLLFLYVFFLSFLLSFFLSSPSSSSSSSSWFPLLFLGLLGFFFLTFFVFFSYDAEDALSHSRQILASPAGNSDCGLINAAWIRPKPDNVEIKRLSPCWRCVDLAK